MKVMMMLSDCAGLRIYVIAPRQTRALPIWLDDSND